MIGVWAGFTQRTWLFISNGQQFAHLSAHRAQYAPILPFFYPSLRPLLLPALLHPYIYTSSFQSSFTFSFLLPLPPFLPLPPPSLFPAKWCHQSLLRPLPSLITQSASGCSWMHLYGLTARARGQAGGYICHDSNALTQRSTLWPGPPPEWSRHTYTGNQVCRQTMVCVCINKWTGNVCLERCPEIPKCWKYTHAHKHTRRESAVTGTPPVPPLSPLVFTKKSRRQPIFQQASGIQKQPSTLWPPILCQDKMCFLPTASSVFLSFPELYLPHIIVNCLLSEIYSVRRSDS